MSRNVDSVSDKSANPPNAGGTQVVLIPESLCVNSLGDVRGTIFFRRGPFCFPADNWNDFAAILLGWWLRALLPLVGGEDDHAELLFMEGLYEVDVRAMTNHVVVLDFFDDGRSRAGLQRCPLPQEALLPLIASILSAADFVADFAGRAAVKDRALNRLNSVRAEMRAKFAGLQS